MPTKNEEMEVSDGSELDTCLDGDLSEDIDVQEDDPLIEKDAEKELDDLLSKKSSKKLGEWVIEHMLDLVFAGVVIFVFAMIYGIVWKTSVLVPQAKDVDLTYAGFSEGNAMIHFKEMADVPRSCLSEGNLKAMDYIEKQLINLKKIALQSNVTIEVDRRELQHVGSYPFGHYLHFNVTNVLARISWPKSGPEALLVSTHFDSDDTPSDSLGVSASGIALGLELVRGLIYEYPRKHSVIIAFMNCHELNSLGAAAFIAKHPWWSSVRGVLNYNPNGILKGPQVLSRHTGNEWLLQLFKSSAPHKRGNSVLMDIIERYPGNNDFNFYSSTNISGLDFTNEGNQYLAHVPQDIEDSVYPNSLQQVGNNFYAMLKAGLNHDLKSVKPMGTRREIYFDIFGKLFILLPRFAYVILSGVSIGGGFVVLVACSFVTILKSNRDKKSLVEVIFLIPTTILSFICAIILTFMVGLMFTWMNPLFWYSRPYFGYVIYFFLTFIGLSIPQILANYFALCQRSTLHRSESAHWVFLSCYLFLGLSLFVSLVTTPDTFPHIWFWMFLVWTSSAVIYSLNERFIASNHYKSLINGVAFVVQVGLPFFVMVTVFTDLHRFIIPHISSIPHYAISLLFSFGSIIILFPFIPAFLRTGLKQTGLVVIMSLAVVIMIFVGFFLSPYDKAHPKRIVTEETLFTKRTESGMQIHGQSIQFTSDHDPVSIDGYLKKRLKQLSCSGGKCIANVTISENIELPELDIDGSSTVQNIIFDFDPKSSFIQNYNFQASNNFTSYMVNDEPKVPIDTDILNFSVMKPGKQKISIQSNNFTDLSIRIESYFHYKSPEHLEMINSLRKHNLALMSSFSNFKVELIAAIEFE